MGRALITAGVVLIVIGLMVTFGRRLPGDIFYRSRNVTFYFPIVTCLVLSVLISLVMWFINRL
jgi:hypothetical protein